MWPQPEKWHSARHFLQKDGKYEEEAPPGFGPGTWPQGLAPATPSQHDNDFVPFIVLRIKSATMALLSPQVDLATHENIVKGFSR